MHFSLKYTLLIAIPFVTGLHTASLAMEATLPKEENSPHVEYNADSIITTFLNVVSDCLPDEDNTEIATLIKTIMTLTTHVPRFESLYNVEDTYKEMVDVVEESNSWPQVVTLNYHQFYAEGKELAAFQEALNALKKYPNLGEQVSHKVHEDDAKIYTLNRNMKLENVHEFIALLQALKTLKDYVYQTTTESQTEQSVYCDACKKDCAAVTVDENTINPDIYIRLECNHIFHLACAPKARTQSHASCPTCQAPFLFDDTQIVGFKRNPTLAEIAALYALIHPPVVKQSVSCFARSREILTKISQSRSDRIRIGLLITALSMMGRMVTSGTWSTVLHFTSVGIPGYFMLSSLYGLSWCRRLRERLLERLQEQFLELDIFI